LRAGDYGEVSRVVGGSKSQSNAAFVAGGYVGDFGDGVRGAGGGEDCVGPGKFVEDGEQLQLGFEFIGGGFDDQVGIADGVLDSDANCKILRLIWLGGLV